MNEENNEQTEVENDSGNESNYSDNSNIEQVENGTEEGTESDGESDSEGNEETQEVSEGETIGTESTTTGGQGNTVSEGFAGSEEYIALIEEIQTLQEIGRSIHDTEIMLLCVLGFALGVYMIHDLFEGLRKLW